MQDDPQQADYVALYVAIAAERRQHGPINDLLDLLNEALKREPVNERARLTRGQLLKRQGDTAAAYKDFRIVAARNPRNLDAVREVRLYRMRGGKNDGEKRDSLFGKLFKR
jgi:lipopolysaccharide biosynthesis regulator YciM